MPTDSGLTTANLDGFSVRWPGTDATGKSGVKQTIAIIALRKTGSRKDAKDREDAEPFEDREDAKPFEDREDAKPFASFAVLCVFALSVLSKSLQFI